MKHIVCYSGGHSSALVAIEVSRMFGAENVVLLNHDMHFSVEHADIKRFKQEVADYIGVPITFANRRNATQDQFDVCVEAKAFKVSSGPILCTSRLKTEPFMDWLVANVPTRIASFTTGLMRQNTNALGCSAAVQSWPRKAIEQITRCFGSAAR